MQNSESPVSREQPVREFGVPVWIAMLGALALIGVTYYDSIEHMVGYWMNREEYSHGPLIPVLSLFLIWQRKNEIERLQRTFSWGGVMLTAFGVSLYFLGELSGITIVTQYSLVVTLAGVVFSLTGWEIFRRIWVAFLFLVFMIPLPAVIFQGLSQQLQLVSSEIGVAIIRLFGISVYLEGNVIDLGTYKLQVVEACSGLRYLFPLMSLAFICAYFYKERFWKRVFVFLSSIPITVLLNSIRIGIIGILVEYWGQSMAEGFLHDFEGWVVFMVCISILILEMWLLAQLGGGRRALSEVFAVDLPDDRSGADRLRRAWPASYTAALALVAVMAVGARIVGARQDIIPQRQSFIVFPMQIDEWHGRPEVMDRIYVDKLDFTDYVLADYRREDGSAINLYAVYYDVQRKGASIHSPRACLPGGGWRIDELKEYSIPGDKSVPGMVVNRAVIRHGDLTQLVYYWFKQRDRIVTGEYEIKWYLFLDALTRNRTDGALIRLTTMLGPGEDLGDGDRRLGEFARKLAPMLTDYIPD